MMKNIFESRTLQGIDSELELSVNVDINGSFYGLGIYPSSHSNLEFSADNEEWIKDGLYPALENWLYYKEEIPEYIAEELEGLGRKEKVALFEMISSAMALGWFTKNA